MSDYDVVVIHRNVEDGSLSIGNDPLPGTFLMAAGALEWLVASHNRIQAENAALREALDVSVNEWQALAGTDSQPEWLRKQAALNARSLRAALEGSEEG